MSDSQEYETAEQLKSFLRKYGWMIAVTFLALVGSLMSYYFYDQSQTKSLQQLAELDYQLVNALKDKKETEAKTLIAQIQKEHPKKEMSVVSSMKVAKFYFDEHRLDLAYENLVWAKDNAKDPELRAMIVLRIASVLLDQKKFDLALSTLEDKNLPRSFRSLVDELKGDIYVAQNKKEEAKQAYSEAMDGASEEDVNFLKMKVNGVY